MYVICRHTFIAVSEITVVLMIVIIKYRHMLSGATAAWRLPLHIIFLYRGPVTVEF